jgi:hypothetical protein
MAEKMIRVAGKEFPASNEKEIRETIKKLRKELMQQKKIAGGNDEICFAIEDAIEMLKEDLKEMKKAKVEEK